MKPIRKLDVSTPTIYLTFDDGPDPLVTPRVLDCLNKHGAGATFFVVGQLAEQNESLVRRMVDEGHAVGNHTWDHRYRNFFTSKEKLRAWIARADQTIEKITGKRAVGFRSPAGVLTPPLLRVVREMNHRLLHWDLRFYDTNFPFSADKARAAADRLESGALVLLHDGHARDVEGLLAGLEALLVRGKERGFEFRKID